jgi:hypothetical protein
VLLHAGDITTHKFFAQFRTEVLAARLNVTASKVEYQFASGKSHLEATLFDRDHPERFVLPHIDGKPIDLRPPTSYQSLFLNGEFGSDQFAVTVGPVKRLPDFSK